MNLLLRESGLGRSICTLLIYLIILSRFLLYVTRPVPLVEEELRALHQPTNTPPDLVAHFELYVFSIFSYVCP